MSRKPAPSSAASTAASSSSADLSVIRIKPYFYIHVHDSNTSVTRVEVGPHTFTRKDHEKVTFGPEQMVMIPPRFYVVIANPVQRNKDHQPIFDDFGNAKLRHGDEEVRFEQDPFPLFPGEQLQGKINPLQVVAPNTALRLRALRDLRDGEVKRNAGDEWLFPGPATYYPRVEVQIVEIVKAVIVKPNTALKLRARKDCRDFYGKPRRVGEEWIVLEEGAYLPNVDEEIVETVKAYILTQDKALHLRANKTFKDRAGVERKAGEEWLITNADKEVHIPDIFEEVLGERKLTTLNNRQYCIVVDPIGHNGKPQLGKRELRKGEVCFFLRPGESLERGIQNVEVLGEEEALLLRAREEFVDGDEKHPPGDRWMIYGPCDYVPPVEVEILEKRRSIPLDKNEGIYARDIKAGTVRAVVGQTYMLKPYEELWEKDLPKVVEDLLSASRSAEEERPSAAGAPRDKTRVVTYRAPHNTAVQIYDYKEKKSRIVFGPDLVMLGPDEQFTVLSLSGDKPKRPHVIKALGLQLGPEFMTDIVIVETSDHARLSLKLSYNWYFEVDRASEESIFKLFQVPDFVGDACKAIASRVRGAVAAVSFDHFHKNSARTIRSAVFGLDERGKVNAKFIFSANNLVITNIDIQSVEPVDQKTRDSLQKSVQLAIEITTKSQEAAAKHEAERAEQEAKGRLERQKLSDEAEAEKARKELLALQSQSHVVEETGRATAEAKARAEAARIEGEAAVGEARLRAEATRIRADADIIQLRKRQTSEISYQKALNDLTLHRAKALADIEASKFHSIVDAIGATTIESIARAGPEMQAKLLSGLGLKSFLITDGNSPINLFNTASGLLGGAPEGAAAPLEESL